MVCYNGVLSRFPLESKKRTGGRKKKNRAPSSILHEAKIAYYARNMFEAARLVFS